MLSKSNCEELEDLRLIIENEDIHSSVKEQLEVAYDNLFNEMQSLWGYASEYKVGGGSSFSQEE